MGARWDGAGYGMDAWIDVELENLDSAKVETEAWVGMALRRRERDGWLDCRR